MGFEMNVAGFTGALTDNSFLFGTLLGQQDTAPIPFQATAVYNYIVGKADARYAPLGAFNALQGNALQTSGDHWDGLAKKAKNFGDGVDAQDLVTLAQLSNAQLAVQPVNIPGLGKVTGPSLNAGLDYFLFYQASSAAYKAANPTAIVTAALPAGISWAGPPMLLTNTAGTVADQVASFGNANTSAAANDYIYQSFLLYNSNHVSKEYVRLAAVIDTVTAGAEDGHFRFYVMNAGTLTATASLTKSSFRPVQSINLDLGITNTNPWGNLFQNTGKKLDWGNGNATLTHSAGLLTLAGSGAVGLTLTAGNVILTAGNLTLTAGNVVLTVGNLTLSSGAASITNAGLPLTVTNSGNTVSDQVSKWVNQHATGAASDRLYHSFFMNNAAGATKEFARGNIQVETATGAAEDGGFVWSVMAGGTLTDTLHLLKNALRPNAGVSGTVDLGTTSTNLWGNVFLGSGKKIDWNSGNVTLTHSAGTLTANAKLVTSVASLPLDVTNSTNAAANQVGKFSSARGTGANSDSSFVSYFLANDAGTQKEFGRQIVNVVAAANGAENGSFSWQVMNAGTLTGVLSLGRTALTLTSASASFVINGTGACGMEIGRTDNVASTPFIDFHSSTTGANDYDSRLIASGGGASAGLGVLQVVGGFQLGVGNATLAPLNFQSGTLETTPFAGDVEWDAVQLYHTIDTTSSRGAIPVEQYLHLTADGGTITTIANFFGATSNIKLVSGAHYIIDIECFFLKTTAGTLTWTLTNSAAPTSQNIVFEMSPITGLITVVTPAAGNLFGQIQNDATAARVIGPTGSLTTAVNHWAHFRIYLINSTGTSLQIQATSNTGSITPQKGSWWRCRRVSSANVGAFAA